MSLKTETTIKVCVDPTNPGQFFACCGLLELAERLWGAEGWFEGKFFCIKSEESDATLPKLLMAAKSIHLESSAMGAKSDEDGDDSDEDQEERKVTPLIIAKPVRLYLDWWEDRSLKPWAGSMSERKILLAMLSAIDPQNADPLNHGQTVFDPIDDAEAAGRNREKRPKKREPFYFDARRGASSLSIDVGFSADSLKLPTVAYPVVEAMSFIGLQRCRPMPTEEPRVFDYFTWDHPLPTAIVPLSVIGLLGKGRGYRFNNGFRTDQRKHKAFNPAISFQRS